MRGWSVRAAGIWFGAIAVATFCLAPIVWLVITSLRPEARLTELGWPSPATLESYELALRAQHFGRAILNSVIVAGASTLLSLSIGASAAFAIAKLELRGRTLVLALALGVSMFPAIATLSPLYLVVGALGLRDRLGGLVLTYTTFTLPLTLWVLTGFFREIPAELFRAARIDGCTPWRAFHKVMLPLAAPGLGTTAILVFVFAYNELMYALTFTTSATSRTIPVALTMFALEHKDPWAQIAAASVITTAPLVAATVLFQRRIVSGLTAGAVKG